MINENLKPPPTEVLSVILLSYTIRYEPNSPKEPDSLWAALYGSLGCLMAATRAVNYSCYDHKIFQFKISFGNTQHIKLD